ncbi:MAG: hypothetical protein Q4A71_01100 [Actinomycetaceae bacterium]|nr:hypothetical protein [Actinomycetaceae bacterium]
MNIIRISEPIQNKKQVRPFTSEILSGVGTLEDAISLIHHSFSTKTPV